MSIALTTHQGWLSCVAAVKMSASLYLSLLLAGVDNGCCKGNLVPQHVAAPYSFYSTKTWLLGTLSACVCMHDREGSEGESVPHGRYIIISS